MRLNSEVVRNLYASIYCCYPFTKWKMPLPDEVEFIVTPDPEVMGTYLLDTGLLEDADAVVHYNGTKFDIPTLNKEFLLHSFNPPSPYKQIDLLRVVRSNFRFPSNKLDYVAQRLNLGKKHEHEGHELWVKCMNGDKDAWKRMEKYNIQDVVLLESLYNSLRPWIRNHPNHNLFADDHVCPNCGSTRLQKRGTSISSTGTYQRYQCSSCGTWSQSTKSIKSSVEVKQCN